MLIFSFVLNTAHLCSVTGETAGAAAVRLVTVWRQELQLDAPPPVPPRALIERSEASRDRETQVQRNKESQNKPTGAAV